jgi:uncharacterized protein YecT (DUF1311 family)
MRIIILLLLATISSTSFGQTQLEMYQQATYAFKNADQELNEIYYKILVEYKLDTVFIKNLKVSQSIWITFRDAELKMKYPPRESGYYGSMYPMCVSRYLEKLTRDRSKILKEWVEGTDNYGCEGSVKLR